MRSPEPVVLRRGRVVLEPWGPQHDAELVEAGVDPEVWRWLPIAQPRTAAAMAEFRETHPGMPWAVVVDGVAAGSTSYLDVDSELGGLEIGATWYRPDLWATEVNPTCKWLLLDHAFRSLGASRVTLKADALNLRSQAAIRKLGCRYDGTLRHQRRRPDGTVRDAAFFSMLAAEWPEAERALLRRLE